MYMINPQVLLRLEGVGSEPIEKGDSDEDFVKTILVSVLMTLVFALFKIRIYFNAIFISMQSFQ